MLRFTGVNLKLASVITMSYCYYHYYYCCYYYDYYCCNRKTWIIGIDADNSYGYSMRQLFQFEIPDSINP